MTTTIPDTNDKEYLRICDKLGFTIPEYKFETSDFEDDSKISPFWIMVFLIYIKKKTHSNVSNGILLGAFLLPFIKGGGLYDLATVHLSK